MATGNAEGTVKRLKIYGQSAAKLQKIEEGSTTSRKTQLFNQSEMGDFSFEKKIQSVLFRNKEG